MSTKLPVVDASGASVAEVELADGWLEHEQGAQAVKDCVVAYLAGLRAGTASTKTRGMVSGGGRKPWRQKHTGSARAGSIRSPLWRGGGVIFGPHPRDFSVRTNKKVRKLALRRAFTERVDEGAVVVVDQLTMAAPKTAHLVALLKQLKLGDRVLVITDKPGDRNLELAARNLPRTMLVYSGNVNVYQMLRFDKVLLSRAALEALGQRLAS